MSRLTIAALLACALSAAACSNNNTTPTPTTPTSTVTDTFSGTLTVNGAATYAFNVNAQGAVYAALTTVSDASAVAGLSLGVYNTTTATCSAAASLSNDAAVQGTTLSASATGVGELCVRIYDVGKLSAPVDYTISVTHY